MINLHRVTLDAVSITRGEYRGNLVQAKTLLRGLTLDQHQGAAAYRASSSSRGSDCGAWRRGACSPPELPHAFVKSLEDRDAGD